MNLEKIKEMLAEGKYLYFTSDTAASVIDIVSKRLEINEKHA